VILAPTRIYVKPVLQLLNSVDVKGLAHITGGGLLENVPRVLPEALTAQLDRKAWTRAPLFDWLQAEGGVADAEMYRVFNCGIGMVIVVAERDVATALECLAAQGESAGRIGLIRARKPGETQTIVA
jgi:phosphoribosylformylglycinamidine cyclo-ligase